MMKKNYYAFAAVVALLAISCAKEVNDGKTESAVPGEKAVTVQGSVAGEDSKVSIDNAGAFQWQDSDKITILTDNGNNREFTAGAAGLTADFSGYIPDADKLDGGYALYPASKGHVNVETLVGFDIPSEIKWSADASNMPMFGKIAVVAGKPQVAFKAVGGVLKLVCFNIPDGATQLAFTAKSVKIAGEFDLDATEAEPAINAEASDTGKEIIINFADSYSSSKVFYIPLPVGTLTGGFTIALYNDNLDELFSVTSTKAVAISRNSFVIAPTLNCDAPSADAGITNTDISSSSLTNSYSTGSITTTYGESTLTWNYNACKQTANKIPYMQLRYNDTESYLQLPSFSDEIASIVLKDIHNAGGTAYTGTLALRSTADNDADPICTATPSVSSGSDYTFTIPSKVKIKTAYLMTDEGLRFASITVKFRGGAYTAPALTVDAEELAIGVGEASASTNVSLANPVDALGVSAVLDGTDKDKFTAELAEGVLTVTAKAVNASGADYSANVTVRATGVAAKSIAVSQANALVPNPSDLSAIAGDTQVEISWTAAEHASAYKAYLRTAEGAPVDDKGDLTEGTTEVTDFAVAEGVYSKTVTGLTNDTAYTLYVKVSSVADGGWVAPATFVTKTFTPEKAKGVEDNPYLASEAYDVIAKYASGKGPEGEIYVQGYVSTANTVSSGSQTYMFSDDGTSIKAFQAYQGKAASGADFTSNNKVSVGDWVVVKGTAVNYSGTTPQFSAGSQLVTHHPKLSVSFGLEEGTYYSAQSLTISSADGATIHYTTDGTEPTTESSVYSGALDITSTTTVKALAVKENCVNSDVASVTITIAAPTKLETPVVTVSEKTHSAISFAWESVEHATGYKVSTDGGTTWGDIQTARTYTWTGLEASTEYTLKVKAIGTTNGQYLDSEVASCTETTEAPSLYSWKETALSSISSGDVFVIVGNNGSNYAISNDNGTSAAPDAVSVTVTGDEITSTVADNIKWNLTVSENNYVFCPNGSTTTWLYCTNTNNGVRVGGNDDKTFIISDEGYLKHVKTSRYVGVYNSGDWRCYTSINNNIKDQTFKFYKYTSNVPTYAITVDDAIEHGSVSADPSGSQAEGTSISLTATPDSGYELSAWDVYKTEDNTVKVDVVGDAFTMPAYSVTVSASFAQVQDPTILVHKTSISGVPANGVTDASETGVYEFLNGATDSDVHVTIDGTVVLAAAPDNGAITYTVSANTGIAREGWIKVQYGVQETTTITVSQDAAAYALTLSATNGTVTATVDQTAVASGSSVTVGKTVALANSPADGYTFSSWSVYKTGDQSTTVTVSNNSFTMPAYPVTVVGNFEEKKETVDPLNVTATFNGKNETYTSGWSTNGTGKGRTDCIIIGKGENITSPSFDLSQYSSVKISIKARRYGTLSNSKATIDVSIAGTSVGTTDADKTSATTSLTDITFTPTASMTAATLVFTCTNATSAGSTHGAGINTITIVGTPKK